MNKETFKKMWFVNAILYNWVMGIFLFYLDLAFQGYASWSWKVATLVIIFLPIYCFVLLRVWRCFHE
jgi:hypothetical protein